MFSHLLILLILLTADLDRIRIQSCRIWNLYKNFLGRRCCLRTVSGGWGSCLTVVCPSRTCHQHLAPEQGTDTGLVDVCWVISFPRIYTELRSIGKHPLDLRPFCFSYSPGFDSSSLNTKHMTFGTEGASHSHKFWVDTEKHRTAALMVNAFLLSHSSFSSPSLSEPVSWPVYSPSPLETWAYLPKAKFKGGGHGMWCSNSLHKAVLERIWNGDCQNRKQPSQCPPAWVLKMSPHRAARDGEKPPVSAWTEDALGEGACPLISELDFNLCWNQCGDVFIDLGKNSANQVKNYNPLLTDTFISMEDFVWNVISLRKSILQEILQP